MCLSAYWEGLAEARVSRRLNDQEYNDELETVSELYIPIEDELKVLRKQRSYLIEEMEDLVPTRERISEDSLQQAYKDTIVARVLKNSSKLRDDSTKRKKRYRRQARYDQLDFQKAVDDYYGSEHRSFSWCHLTGWVHRYMIKATHLVPEALSGDEISFFFGDKEVDVSFPANGLLFVECHPLTPTNECTRHNTPCEDCERVGYGYHCHHPGPPRGRHEMEMCACTS